MEHSPNALSMPKAAEAPEPDAIKAAAEQLAIAHQALLTASRHLDSSPTRRLHIEATELRDRTGQISASLTEWVSW